MSCGEASVASAIETYRLQHLQPEGTSCGEASVASAIETMSLSFLVMCFSCVAGKQASRLRLKPCSSAPAEQQLLVAGKQASRLRLKHVIGCSTIHGSLRLRGSKRRVCD